MVAACILSVPLVSWFHANYYINALWTALVPNPFLVCYTPQSASIYLHLAVTLAVTPLKEHQKTQQQALESLDLIVTIIQRIPGRHREVRIPLICQFCLSMLNFAMEDPRWLQWGACPALPEYCMCLCFYMIEWLHTCPHSLDLDLVMFHEIPSSLPYPSSYNCR